ncbi:exodeoxyribonuclease III [Marinibactrum halimedae]|uniref:Exonuclease III n=1 Tax=Marinibactrum halimedae TaxID=1444977 RepID=A0AA37TFE9_9GAMM|nr:exodeoxyribonuclease III [Marinibactrum halimedae]MCD9459453.1 exodeoxyribonuclease III [Marinibactrum halimedae]GLS28107.1 exonuclease III [Marinibactrum halimedae]
MKIVSFNVNSLRARLHQLEAVIRKHSPDFIGLQETKVRDEEFPLAEIEALGYHPIYHGQKTHYGVALLSKETPTHSQKGFEGEAEDAQRRFVLGEFDRPYGKLVVANGYFPQGENRDHPTKYPNKKAFYEDLQALLEQRYSPNDHIIVMGDMNISPEDIDIGIGEDNRKRWLRTGKCSFLPEEREWLQRLKDWGLSDTYRLHYSGMEQFSWFDYRSKGFDREPKRGLRIDLIMATEILAKQCLDAGIDYDIRSLEKSSDHCPVWATFAE